MNPLERAARALAKLDGHSDEAISNDKALLESYSLEAHCVLSAVRTPDRARIHRVYVEGAWNCSEEELGIAWQSLIDAALGET